MHRPRRGTTLLEAMLTVTVLSIIAAVISPVIAGAADVYSATLRSRRAAEHAAFAMERSLRLLRDIPGSPLNDTIGLQIAEPARVRFTDGRGIELQGTDLLLRDANGTTSILAQNVDAFEVAYFTNDNAALGARPPETTWRFTVRIRVDGFELRGGAFPRVLMLPT